MRFAFGFLLPLTCAALSVWAQDQTPASAPVAPPPAPLLVNNGKPIVLPFQCTAEDLQAAGFTCSEEAPCPIYLELSAATAAGNHYYVAGNIHSAAVTLYSVLLGSEDAGRTWREINPRIRGAGVEHLQFLDSESGWAAGQQLFPLPQDPFVLYTADAGKTWRQQPVLGESAENRFGSIQQFFFSSKTSGNLIIDRSQGGDAGPFALYESGDGGETWSIKQQSSKALKIPGAPDPDAEWRVRVDAPSKAFHMERRQGERWTSHAAFAVSLGACKVPAQ